MAALCETAARDERRAPVASLGYTRRQVERTVLHQVVREHLETFLATGIRVGAPAERRAPGPFAFAAGTQAGAPRVGVG